VRIDEDFQDCAGHFGCAYLQERLAHTFTGPVSAPSASGSGSASLFAANEKTVWSAQEIIKKNVKFCMVVGVRRLDDQWVGNLGKNLRAARKKLGLTQEEVAERSGVQAGEVSRIERGKRDPQVSTLEKLAGAVELPPGRLLD
jgi:DNA-binding XRE family transcriptional regulator